MPAAYDLESFELLHVLTGLSDLRLNLALENSFFPPSPLEHKLLVQWTLAHWPVPLVPSPANTFSLLSSSESRFTLGFMASWPEISPSSSALHTSKDGKITPSEKSVCRNPTVGECTPYTLCDAEFDPNGRFCAAKRRDSARCCWPPWLNMTRIDTRVY